MVDKKITISAAFDTSEFDRKVQELQKKLQKISSPVDQSSSVLETSQRLKQAGYQPLTPDAEARHKQNLLNVTKELDKFIKQQSESESKILQALDNRIKKLNELKKLNLDDLKTEKEKASVKEQILKNEQSIERLSSISRANNQTINEAMDRRADMPQERAPRSLGQRVGDWFSSSGADVLRAGAGLIGTASQVGQEVAGLPRSVASTMGQTVVSGSDLSRSVYGKGLARDVFFGKERSQAAGMATKESGLQPLWDWGGLAGAGVASVAAGAIGTAFASPIGGAAALGGTFMGMTNERQRMLIPSLFGLDKGYVEASRKQQALSQFQESKKGLEDQQYLRQLAFERFGQTSGRNLSAQRMLGIENQGFYGKGGFLGQGFNQGFSDDQTISSAQAIMSAGGTTAGALSSATLANQLSRNNNLTNASSILGRLTGTGMSGEQSKDSIIKVLSEGMRIGLDSSKYAQEQRKFAENVAEIAYRTGMTDPNAIGGAAQALGGFTQDLSTRGMSAGMSAYQSFQNQMGQSSGASNFIRQVGITTDPVLSGLNPVVAAKLSELSPEQIQRGGDTLEEAAGSIGIPVEELQDRLLKSSRRGVTTTPQQEKRMESLSKKYGTREGMQDFQKRKKLGQVSKQEYQDISEFKAMQSATGMAAQKYGSLEFESEIGGQLAFMSGEGSAKIQDIMGQKSTKVEDVKERAEAKQAQATTEEMAGLMGQMGESFKQIAEASVEQVKALVNSSEKLKEGKTTIEDFNKEFDKFIGKVSQGTSAVSGTADTRSDMRRWFEDSSGSMSPVGAPKR